MTEVAEGACGRRQTLRCGPAAYGPRGRPDVTAEYMLKTHAGFVEQAMDALAR